MEIVAPQAGSSVADSVRIVVSASDDRTVESVTVRIDQRRLARRTQAPWEFAWDTSGLPDSSLHRLQAEAEDAAGNRGRSAELEVCVRRNSPPTLRLLWPPDGHWANLDRPAADWRCVAADPEEGQLAGERIVWFVDAETLATRGSLIPAPPLAEGMHEIRIEARDRWGRRARVQSQIHAFRYPSGQTPSGLLEVFTLALRARDARTALACLSEDFVLLPPLPQAAALRWMSDQHREALERLCDPERVHQVRLQLRAGSTETFQWHGRPHAMIELRNFHLEAVIACEGADSPRAGERRWEVRSPAERVFLRATERSAAGPGWELIGWWDLHRAHGHDAIGPAWADLLSAAREKRLCD
ncbi:MAG: hypothetical protein GF330_06360 [Candidatus Eisenbacteria bacterium]|nr:hypothetical protein [Candidatus Eisenbacteria bacterium]